jgi:preprotein translocase subunit YajC
MPGVLTILGAAGDAGSGSFFGPETLAFIGIVFFAFYFLILRPQRQEQRKREEAINQLAKGDKVVTAGGIHGVLANVSGKDTVEVEVAKNVRLTFNRTSISVVESAKAAKEKEKETETKKS